jgi:hypothetical protein
MEGEGVEDTDQIGFFAGFAGILGKGGKSFVPINLSY